MPRIRPQVCCVLSVLVAFALAPRALAQEGGDLAAWLTQDGRLRQVMPGAARVEPAVGQPPAAPVYGTSGLLGFAFSTRAVVGSVGYSGKPFDVVAAVGLDGRLTGALLREHHEPILVIGIADRDLDAFVDRFRGVDVRETVVLAGTPAPGQVALDAISGATVSSVVISDAVLRAGRAIARTRGLLEAAGSGGRRLDIDSFAPLDWDALLAAGGLAHLHLRNRAVDAALGETAAPGAGVDPEATFIDLYVGLATPALVGRNLLGSLRYNRLLADRAAQVLFVAANGRYSFKGTGYVRSGVFDRVQIVQGARTLRLAKDQHQRVEALAIAGAPAFREMALFTLPPTSGLDPTLPWRFELYVSRPAAAGAVDRMARFAVTYQPPARLLELPAPAEAEAAQAGGNALWLAMWRERSGRIAVLGAALLCLTAILFLQDALSRRPRLYNTVRLSFLGFTLLWLGWYAGAQLSVVNVFSFTQALLGGFRWELFLVEPLIFVLWSFVAVTMLFWGRGVFCGWLCPFGALQELLNRGARALRVPQLTVPFAVHERLWPLKYIIFLVLFGVSLASLDLAVWGAEVEPFKTVVSMHFLRAWPFVAYAAALLAAGLVVERVFCRYLCPLGAALAIPARIRMFDWLKRRPQCGAPCQSCAVTCTVQAIHPDGRINPNECIHCLNCQVLYFDDRRCPPLIERRKRRERREGADATAAAT